MLTAADDLKNELAKTQPEGSWIEESFLPALSDDGYVKRNLEKRPTDSVGLFLVNMRVTHCTTVVRASRLRYGDLILPRLDDLKRGL